MTAEDLLEEFLRVTDVAIEAMNHARRLATLLRVPPHERNVEQVLDRLGPEPPGGFTARQVGAAFGRRSRWARVHSHEFPGACPTNQNNGEWRFPLAGIEYYVRNTRQFVADHHQRRRPAPRRPLREFLAAAALASLAKTSKPTR